MARKLHPCFTKGEQMVTHMTLCCERHGSYFLVIAQLIPSLHLHIFSSAHLHIYKLIRNLQGLQQAFFQFREFAEATGN